MVNNRKMTIVNDSKWLNAVFSQQKISDVLMKRDGLYLGSPVDVGCVINNPNRTMSNPFMGVDLFAINSLVIGVAKSSDDARKKPLLVSVRGTGGGKTRLFEEIRRALIRDISVLPIAITFNSNSSISTMEFLTCGRLALKASCSASLSIICRMTSAFFGIEVAAMRNHMEKHIHRLDPEFDEENLFLYMEEMMRRRMAEAGHPVKHVVLLVDEVLNLQHVMNSKFPNDITATDILAPLRSAFLDKTSNNALAISSLTADLGGVNLAGRPLAVLQQCERFDPHEIVTLWWNLHGDADIMLKYRLLASLLGDLPRALEDAKDLFQQHQGGDCRALFTRDIIDRLRTTLSARYGARSTVLPSPQLLYGIWYRDTCDLNTEAVEAIMTSQLTNVLSREQIHRTSVRGLQPATFTPRANLLMLSMSTPGADSFPREFLHLLDRILRSTIGQPESRKPETSGDLLDLHTALVLQGRIGVAMNADKETTPARLLGLKGSSVKFVPALQCKIVLTRDMAEAWDSGVPTLQNSSYTTKTTKQAFWDELASIQVSAEYPVALLRSALGGAFDLVLKVFEPRPSPGPIVDDSQQQQHCHYVFIDNKNQHKPDRLPGDEQAEQIKQVMDGQSIAYVYMATHPYDQQCKGNVVFAGHEQTFKFLGPVGDFYTALRTDPQ